MSHCNMSLRIELCKCCVYGFDKKGPSFTEAFFFKIVSGLSERCAKCVCYVHEVSIGEVIQQLADEDCIE